VITLESLRVDHVGCLEGTRDTTPALDALARESVVYDDAHSVTSWTLAAHASLFTGLYPTAHQTVGPADRLGDSYETLAEILAKRGYQCAAVVSGPYLRRSHGLDQGFEHYDESPSTDHDLSHSAVTNEKMHLGLLRFLDEQRDPGRPLLLFAYYWDPHYDFLPPPPYDQRFVTDECEPIDVRGFGTRNTIHPGIRPGQMAWVLSQYDGEIRWTDDTLGQLFGALKSRDLWKDALVIVTADHGEEFFDHGRKGHKNNLFAETIRVPLVVKYPDGEGGGRRDSRLVSHVDVLPTILDLAGAKAEMPLPGISLRSEPRPGRAIYQELLETWYLVAPESGEAERRSQQWYAIRRGDLKYVTSSRGLHALFDVREDPWERRSILGERPEDAASMQQSLDRWSKEMERFASFFSRGGTSRLTPAQLENLRSLGYVRD